MKKIAYLIIAAAMLSSCSEDFLNVEPLTEKTSANFPLSADDAKQMMGGIYTTMNNEQRNCDQSHLFVCEIASDEKLGGGGSNDLKALSYESFMYSDANMLNHTWEATYEGIHRANFVIESIDKLSDIQVKPDLKNQYKGEAYFLRAFFYFRLATLFGNVPLKISTPQADLGNASSEEIYGQIASDLKQAITLLPKVTYSSTEEGRVTLWAAQAMMARVWLFYTGFYQQASLPGVSKAEVTNWLLECKTSSGHSLVGDFHELWPYTNSLSIGDYPYIQDYMTKTGKTLKFAADKGARSPETIFALKFNNFADWDIRRGYGNMYQLFFGLRGMQPVENTIPFSGGWGQGNSIPKGIVDEWVADEPNDIRLWASVIDIAAELPTYKKGEWSFVLESNYWGKKYNGVTAIDPKTGTRAFDYSVGMYNNTNNNQLSHSDDLVFIRYADVLLMLSELTEDAQYMNEVRGRVGLPAIAYSLENLQKERRHELAFEGLRWNDMRRWGADYTKAALESQVGAPVYNFYDPNPDKGKNVTVPFTCLNPKGYSTRYDETKGFFPIPEKEIEMSKGLLKQTPGYEGQLFPGFPN